MTLLLGVAPTGASAAPRDVASTQAYLVATHAALQAVVGKWSSVEAGIHQLDLRFRAECPDVGAGSPQSEEEQKLSYEVAGALWATGYHTDIKVIRSFVKAVAPLSWSNPTITRDVRKFTKGLQQMGALPVPNLCGDVRTWAAGGYKAVPADTEQFDRRVEAIEIKEVPRGLLLRYLPSADRPLLAQTEHLATRFEELEFSHGQVDWNTALETLGLNQ
ncbi:MAG TPA: hypothetical protein VGP18_06160 [Solirubrobacteraceae bacterium]|nr:hypothetical protein [Solirubrobacteraceae bacterium]